MRILTYDLNKEKSKADYDGFYEVIKSYPSWARLSESSYAIETSDSPQAIYNKLKPYIDDNDNVLILTLTPPYWGQHSKEVIDWLQKRLSVY